MWTNRLKELPRRHKLGLGIGTAVALVAGVWLVSAPIHLGSIEAVHQAADPKVQPKAPISRPAVNLPSQGLSQMTAEQAVLLKAKFAVLTAPEAVHDDGASFTPPSAPVGAGRAPASPAADGGGHPNHRGACVGRACRGGAGPSELFRPWSLERPTPADCVPLIGRRPRRR
jgi:hypothetical protein